MLGELESASRFFAHSSVLWEADGAVAAADSASSIGDVSEFPFEVDVAGLGSVDWNREERADDLVLLLP